MPDINTTLNFETSFVNLKEIPADQVREDIVGLFVPGEEILQAFHTIRDQVVFTNKRIFVVNVQGLTGTKVAYLCYPYAKVLFYGVQTAGLLGIDNELLLVFTTGIRLQLEFSTRVDIRRICAAISQFILR